MASRATGDVVHDGHVAQWHRWQEQPNLRYMPTYWQAPNAIFTQLSVPSFRAENLQELIETVAKNELFLLADNLLNQNEFSYADDLLGHECAVPYLTSNGTLPALRVRHKRKSGFLVSAATWLWTHDLSERLVRELEFIFNLFGFQATTPASLSEKEARKTLPDKLHISKPALGLLNTFLAHPTVARIDKALLAFYERAYCYDENKAYLFHSRRVPSPYLAPVYLYCPALSELDHFPTYRVLCDIVVAPTSIAPVLVDGKNPECMGEVLSRWLWREELEDCLDAGYKLVAIHGGYGFREMSGFLEKWIESLWEKYLRCETEWQRKVLKRMMHGVPGRFLTKPYKYTLTPFEQAQKGDIPIKLSGKQGKVFSNWVARPEYDRGSSSLIQIGDYIKMQASRDLYHRMLAETRAGNTVIKSYIDMYATVLPTMVGDLGTQAGQWKEKRYQNIIADGTKWIGWNEEINENEMKAPGSAKQARIALWQRYYSLLEKHGKYL